MIEKLAYEELMSENNLTLTDLNDEARVGIEIINDVKKSINMLSKKGKTVSEKVLRKVKTNDKWICQEILEILDGKQRNETPEAPHSVTEIVDDIKKDEIKETTDSKVIDEDNVTDPQGIKIDEDLLKAHTAGTTTLTADELLKASPTAYAIISSSYEEGTLNGIETSFYTLIEKEKHVFTLTKK